jgi:ubiquinone/menaquinone biosynthesis C-methylase UbiE
MSTRADQAREIQRRYYTDTASRYDCMHAHEGATDASITIFMHALLRELRVRSLLDVGTATGLGMRNMKEALPELFVCGVEPVAALIRQGVEDGNNSSFPMIRASGEALPFPDASFDAVCEFSTLHHVPDPNAVVREMLRVARKAVFICDSNRFGQGSRSARLLKLALYWSKMWPVFDFMRTRGRRYMINEGDGLWYSYSVYDSFDLVARWADRVILIPAAKEKAHSWLHPLLNSSGVLFCAIRE